MQVLDAIMQFTREHKYPPSVRDLCDMLNLSSASTVHGYLERLKIQGLLTWEPGSPRTLRVLEGGEQYAEARI